MPLHSGLRRQVLSRGLMSDGRDSMPNRLPVGDAAVETANTLSIITSTYNARDVLAECLQSIYRNPTKPPL
jgi:hypothetical protein